MDITYIMSIYLVIAQYKIQNETSHPTNISTIQ